MYLPTYLPIKTPMVQYFVRLSTLQWIYLHTTYLFVKLSIDYQSNLSVYFNNYMPYNDLNYLSVYLPW
jgi:hypothetical protein